MQQRPSSASSNRSRAGRSTRDGDQIELGLRVQFGDNAADILVTAEAWATVRDLLDGLDAALPGVIQATNPGSADKVAVVCERLGAWLELDRTIVSCDLLDGDRLVFGSFADLRGIVEASTAVVPGSVELAIRGGPRAGERLLLTRGEHVVGRDIRSAEIAFPGDSSMSGRHLRLLVGPSGVAVEDLGSTNGTFIDGGVLPVRALVPLSAGSLLEAGRTTLSWKQSADLAARQRQSDGRGRVTIDRPPRVRRPWVPEPIDLAAPPEAPRRIRIPILASLVPVILGVALWRITGNEMMLLFALVGPIVAVASRLEEMGFGTRDYRRGSREFRDRLATAETALDAALVREGEARRAEAPDAAILLGYPSELGSGLWSRRPTDPDVLDVRVGSADQPAMTRVLLAKGGNLDTRREAEDALALHGPVRSVPVIVPLARWGSVGLVGSVDRVDGLGRWIMLQAAILQPPSELRICAALAPARLRAWEWLKWLPHARANGPGESQPTVIGAEATATLLDTILADAAAGPRADGRRTLVVIDGSVATDARLVSRLLQASVASGIVVVWLADEDRALPNGIASIVRMDPAAARLDLVEVATATTITGASADGVPLAVAESTARTMAPFRDPTAAGASNGMPRQVSLLQATAADLSPAAIEAAWAAPDARAVIGMTAGGPFVLDLARDGPHALVGGTTGSGKSELLQALVTSLALTSPPSRMSFLLVDYKGGAAFRDSVTLPHVAGFVTDLDEHLARRALVSLDAEIRRREGLLASIGAKDIDGALARDPARAPARLLIVVDEFATLAREVPEFIEGIVDVAQRGRTLGVHLVLATQRPAGAVTREIWANTNIRVALRVTDTNDSTDVIGIPDAAAIPRDLPGRAIARVGQADPVQFQAAWAGARVAAADRPALAVRRFMFAGGEPSSRQRAAGSKDSASESGGPAPIELELITAAITAAARQADVEAAPSPWLPPLPETLPLADLAVRATDDTTKPGERAVVGLVDDPGRQRQLPLTVDLAADGGMLIYGGGGSGRTTALRTIAMSIADGASPADMQLFGLDFGAGGLRMLEELPHCGGVAAGSDEERVARLLGMLRGELDRRQHLFADARVQDIGEYRRTLAPGASLPRMVLLLDGYSAFAAAYERVQFGELVDLLPRLAADGRAVGIHLFIAADRRGSVPGRLAGVVKRRLVLRLADDGEYGQLGIDRRAWAGVRFTPGRGLTEDGLEVQVAVAGADGSAAGQRDAVAGVAERTRAAHPGTVAPSVGVLPASVSLGTLEGSRRPGTAVLGLLDRGLVPAEVDLDEGGFLVAGPLRSGRSTALATIATSCAAFAPDTRLYLLAPRRSPLTGLSIWTSLADRAEACDSLVEEIARDPGDAAGPRRVIVIDDGEELFESAAAATLATLVRRGRDVGLRVVAAAELRSASRAYGGWLAELRKDRHGLLLQPGQEMAGELLGATLPRSSSSRPMPPGRGYLVVRGIPELIQVAQP